MQEPFKLIVREEFFKFSLYMFSKILTDQNSLNHLRRGSFVPNYFQIRPAVFDKKIFKGFSL